MAALQQISGLIEARNLGDAAEALQKLVRKKSNPSIDWEAAMRMAASLGDEETALAAGRNWRAQNPGDLRRTVAVVGALAAVAKHDEAARLARTLQNDPVAAADGCFLEGVQLARKGQREEALELFRRAVSLHREHTSAWEHIALLAGFDDVNADLREMAALAKRITQAERLVPLYYALGRTFDHIGDVDNAFQSIAAGAALRTRLSPYSVHLELAYLQRLQSTFSAELVARLQNESSNGGAIFIMAAPRSGSTLTEQILATSPSVTPTGEHTLLRLASLQLASMEPPDMARASQLKTSDWRKMAQAYLTGIRRRFGSNQVYTDKTNLNYYFIGIIRILFPAAKIIWVRRDPRDVVWSCFRSRIYANRWAQDLETCAQFILAHNRMCEHWAALCGADVATVGYEQLVSTPDQSTAALFNHVDVARPDSWQEFYRGANPVATASLAQVRQPLTSKAVGTWRRYERHLAPVYEKYFF